MTGPRSPPPIPSALDPCLRTTPSASATRSRLAPRLRTTLPASAGDVEPTLAAVDPERTRPAPCLRTTPSASATRAPRLAPCSARRYRPARAPLLTGRTPASVPSFPPSNTATSPAGSCSRARSEPPHKSARKPTTRRGLLSDPPPLSIKWHKTPGCRKAVQVGEDVPPRRSLHAQPTMAREDVRTLCARGSLDQAASQPLARQSTGGRCAALAPPLALIGHESLDPNFPEIGVCLAQPTHLGPFLASC
jgi:hypothetical protein